MTMITDRRLWLLLSPTLPVGGYSFSHGLESAVDQGLVTTSAQAQDWILGIAQRMLPRVDLPILLRMLDALTRSDALALEQWNDYLLASRESAELLAEDQHLGAALARLRPAWQLPPADSVGAGPTSFAVSFAGVCHEWQIDPRQACAAYAWIWFENQVAAAVKLVPLGQSEGQSLLLTLCSELETLVSEAHQTEDDQLGAGMPGLALISSAHEQLHGRLFQS